MDFAPTPGKANASSSAMIAAPAILTAL